jgi:hypothetical protein
VRGSPDLDVDGRLVDTLVPRYLVPVQLEPAALGGLQAVLAPSPDRFAPLQPCPLVTTSRSACCGAPRFT